LLLDSTAHSCHKGTAELANSTGAELWILKAEYLYLTDCLTSVPVALLATIVDFKLCTLNEEVKNLRWYGDFALSFIL